MSSTLSLILGLALLVLTAADFVLTTIGAVAQPVISHRFARLVFRGLRGLYHALPRGTPRRLVAAQCGVLVMTSIGIFWVALFSLSWSLVYLAGGPSIRLDQGAAAPGFWDVWAHVGHLLSTLGGAVTRPVGTGWNVVGVLVGITGMVVLTLSVSFVSATTQTVVDARALARLTALDLEVTPAQIARLIQRLKASPFAPYYCEPRSELDVPAFLCVLAEAEGADGARMRRLTEDLPGFDAPDRSAGAEAYLEALSRWCSGYMLEPPPPNQRPARAAV